MKQLSIFLKPFIWLFFGSLIFIFRLKTIREGFFLSRPFPERKHVVISMISVFSFIFLVNMLVWWMIYLIFELA